ncbi:MAG: hypothetical protein DHS20C14_03380 [Phycisphaeraceae bacterium]|nr:MAG: hypothetical protein DHS20C14_03380 [Phycisphaeraceae bacterium]
MATRQWDVEILDADGGAGEWRRVSAKDEFGARVAVEDAGLSVGRVQRASAAIRAHPRAVTVPGGVPAGDGGGAIALAWLSIVLGIVFPIIGLPLAIAATVSGAKSKKQTKGRAGSHAMGVGIAGIVVSCLGIVGWLTMFAARIASAAP